MIRLMIGVLVAVGTICVSAAPTTASDRPQITVQRSEHKPKSHKPRHKRRWINFEATWYSPYEPGQGTVTASGAHVEQGLTIAVDPRIIPLGTRVLIKFRNGLTHWYVAQDTGGAIRGRHIDLFNWSQRQCLINGIQQVKVYIAR